MTPPWKKFGGTPLHKASLGDRDDIAKLLIEHKANVNALQNVRDRLPSFQSAVSYHSLGKGWDLTIALSCNGWCRQCCPASDQSRCESQLCWWCACLQHLSTFYTFPPFTQSQLSLPYLNLIEVYGNTPLQLASFSDHPRLVEILIQAGAKVDLLNKARNICTLIAQPSSQGIYRHSNYDFSPLPAERSFSTWDCSE